ncbi:MULTISPECIES: hypothetical protein [Clostridium]|uniref:Uncharacterized protein n=1 Tax=Clostridium neonatale TaxID=137838 RepID=A0A650MF20_9CLOT|nr:MULTISPECIES: hypothetical protein [Clostridium]MBS4784028.1 hypothetical protein [Clostridium sp.]CAG9701828.1 hypothetical protein CNEO_110053 [Clostridium neonatale]CAG9706856.1 conserved hypothetical protein [Clostridium neonatale]CAG9709255.1 hypothetical protein CNEO_1380002 [Clostridium neonatale]CAI3542379.1 hypothetical protein CNEO4_1330002 [Clostridium neonatale]
MDKNRNSIYDMLDCVNISAKNSNERIRTIKFNLENIKSSFGESYSLY